MEITVLMQTADGSWDVLQCNVMKYKATVQTDRPINWEATCVYIIEKLNRTIY
jgi:hypothetical protein